MALARTRESSRPRGPASADALFSLNMKRLSLPLGGSFLLQLDAHADDRGWFCETFVEPRYRALGIEDGFVQENLSHSRRGVLRGLHGDPRMAKLVQVVQGSIFDAIVDARPTSPTFGRWHGQRLDAATPTQLYVPRGFLHGFLALSDDTIFLYKQTATYDPGSEVGIAWDDPDLAIAWPLAGIDPLLSAKDRANPRFRERFGGQA